MALYRWNKGRVSSMSSSWSLSVSLVTMSFSTGQSICKCKKALFPILLLFALFLRLNMALYLWNKGRVSSMSSSWSLSVSLVTMSVSLVTMSFPTRQSICKRKKVLFLSYFCSPCSWGWTWPCISGTVGESHPWAAGEVCPCHSVVTMSFSTGLSICKCKKALFPILLLFILFLRLNMALYLWNRGRV